MNSQYAFSSVPWHLPCHACKVHTELQAEPVIDRLLGSLSIGNKDSHDSSFEPTFGDMKAFWQDVTDFEKLFFCDTCGSAVSLRYYDEGVKQVSCKKGDLIYTWKK